MSLEHAPSRPQRKHQVVDKDGFLTEFGFQLLDQIWRQDSAGYVIVPCLASGTDIITLTPRMHKEGAAVLADYVCFSFIAANTSAGPVTIIAGEQAARKAYLPDGVTQAGAGDVVQSSFVIAFFVQALDGGAGGFILK